MLGFPMVSPGHPFFFSQDRGKYTYANGDEFMGLWDKGNKLSGTFYYRVWAPQSKLGWWSYLVGDGWRFFCFWNLVPPYLVPSIFGWVETTNYKNNNNLGGGLDNNHDICRVVSTTRTCRCHARMLIRKSPPKCWEIQPAQKIEDLRVHNMDRWTILRLVWWFSHFNLRFVRDSQPVILDCQIILQ